MAIAKTVKRATNILNLFDHTAELGVTDVALKLGIDKSTVHRLMATLEEAKILARSRTKPKYCLGPKILELAHTYLSRVDLKTIGYPYLKELNSKTGDAISLYVREGDVRVCLDRIESSRSVRQIVRVGDRGPLYAGAPGKVLLAELSDNEINDMITKTGLIRHTDRTITSKRRLKEEITKIRKEGFAFSFGEHVELCSTVSAPIRKYGGDVVASLNITWVTDSPDPKKVNEYVILTKETASNISREMGYMSFHQ